MFYVSVPDQCVYIPPPPHTHFTDCSFSPVFQSCLERCNHRGFIYSLFMDGFFLFFILLLFSFLSSLSSHDNYLVQSHMRRSSNLSFTTQVSTCILLSLKDQSIYIACTTNLKRLQRTASQKVSSSSLSNN